MVLLIIISVITLIITFMLIQYYYDAELYNYFKDNNITDIDENSIEDSEMLLLNNKWLPSYRGKYDSLVFNNKFHYKKYSNFIILTMNTNIETFNIKIPLQCCVQKSDIFCGKLLKIRYNKVNLTFKLTNNQQDILHKRFL